MGLRGPPKGIPKTPGSGRKTGTPNKITADLKNAILAALEGAHEGGSVGYLKWLAVNNSGAFAGLVGRIIPTTLAGDSKNPVEIRTDQRNPLEFIEGELARIAARDRSAQDTGRLN